MWSWCLESIVPGDRSETEEMGYCFTPVSPSCCLCRAMSMPASARAGRCCHLSEALQCPGLPGMLFFLFFSFCAWKSVTSYYQTWGEKRGGIFYPSDWRSINRVKDEQKTAGMCLPAKVTTRTHTFTPDALVCPLRCQTRTRHVGRGGSAVVCVEWDHFKVSLPSLAAFSPDS